MDQFNVVFNKTPELTQGKYLAMGSEERCVKEELSGLSSIF